MSETAFQRQLKNQSRGYSRDMSPEAIARRLDIVEEMNRVCGELAKARIIGRTEDLRRAQDEVKS